jgi:hypothetical protein
MRCSIGWDTLCVTIDILRIPIQTLRFDGSEALNCPLTRFIIELSYGKLESVNQSLKVCQRSSSM